MVVAFTPGISEWSSHLVQILRKFVPVSLTRLVNCSIRQIYQILFRIFVIVGKSGSFHKAASSHRMAVAKCAISFCAGLPIPRVRLPSRNNQGSRGTGCPRILVSQSWISSHKGATLGQPHSM
ncbi:hypothetical protein FKM82_024269 [Ascaphus truei]